MNQENHFSKFNQLPKVTINDQVLPVFVHVPNRSVTVVIIV